MEKKYQEISESARLNTDENFTQSEEKIQQLEEAKLLIEGRLVEAQRKNQELRQVSEAQERTLSVNGSASCYSLF